MERKKIIIGIKKSETVLRNLTGMDIIMEFDKLLISKLNNIINNKSYTLYQTAISKEKKWDFYFTMLSDEFLKFLALVEHYSQIDTIEAEDVLDSFLEIGNIICGNVISVLTSGHNEVKFAIPILLKSSEIKSLTVNAIKIKFEVKETDITGYLLFAFNEGDRNVY
ncbi:Chemotaxis phosphatase CheX [Marinitoga hydrogenitolerans DSM 16785]|uniref:Chemotaxis phosphatase CheX n=1 Tax=Marinitoga hydrogenitolerans (strain DSM 16785 / JCM 12826 / AT1271) TaxID=1122195 RepID=A0A1M4UJF4_MARH1|nr:chemotaxis protein CheX [Marinitoga hydrogenitolerans]SHE56795.1 Chemotaxis phosphatase CheX [Marinitoga hydrogenitolerans DSM 16785]